MDHEVEEIEGWETIEEGTKVTAKCPRCHFSVTADLELCTSPDDAFRAAVDHALGHRPATD